MAHCLNFLLIKKKTKPYSPAGGKLGLSLWRRLPSTPVPQAHVKVERAEQRLRRFPRPPRASANPLTALWRLLALGPVF